MAILRYHEQVSIKVQPTPSSDIHVSFFEDTGHEVNVYPLSVAAAEQVVTKLSSCIAQAKGLTIVEKDTTL